MSESLVKEILAAAGAPVGGATLSAEDVERAVEEGRALEICSQSNFGDHETSFRFATRFTGINGVARYLVFPRPIPSQLRRQGGLEWEEPHEVRLAFGIGVEEPLRRRLERYASRLRVSFRETGDARFPFEAVVDGRTWTVRVNELPKKLLPYSKKPSPYSLLVNGEVIKNLWKWPVAWRRPDTTSTPPTNSSPGDDVHERVNFDREQAHFERTRNISPSSRV